MHRVLFKKWVDPAIYQHSRPNIPDWARSDANVLEDEFLQARHEFATDHALANLLVMTTEGVAPANPAARVSSRYNLWVGHTTFRLTPEMMEKVGNLDGVEILSVFTPYRFWLGVGECFLTDEVLERVRQGLLGSVESEKTPDSRPNKDSSPVTALCRSLAVKHQHWAIIQNKQVEILLLKKGESPEEFQSRVEKTAGELAYQASWSWRDE